MEMQFLRKIVGKTASACIFMRAGAAFRSTRGGIQQACSLQNLRSRVMLKPSLQLLFFTGSSAPARY
jgi:hypothetical protein